MRARIFNVNTPDGTVNAKFRDELLLCNLIFFTYGEEDALFCKLEEVKMFEETSITELGILYSPEFNFHEDGSFYLGGFLRLSGNRDIFQRIVFHLGEKK